MGSGNALIVLGLVLAFGVPVGILVAFRRREAAQVRRLRSAGRTTSGYVTGLGTDPGDGMTSPTYWADVHCAGDGEPFTAHVALTPDQYRAVRTGSRLDVTYLPGRPRSARVLGRPPGGPPGLRPD
jgi:hypothetical protein